MVQPEVAPKDASVVPGHSTSEYLLWRHVVHSWSWCYTWGAAISYGRPFGAPEDKFRL